MTEISEKDDVRNLQIRWENLLNALKSQFGKKPNLDGVVFLIGLRELGELPRKFSKEEKVDLMHIALCAVLAPAGYYRLSHQDQQGWPHWEPVKPVPYADVLSQELFLKSHIIDYFADIYEI